MPKLTGFGANAIHFSQIVYCDPPRVDPPFGLAGTHFCGGRLAFITSFSVRLDRRPCRDGLDATRFYRPVCVFANPMDDDSTNPLRAI